MQNYSEFLLMVKWVGITVGIFVLYFLPWIVASIRNTQNRSWVAIVNVFFGFSIIGWFIALAMAGGEKHYD